MTRLEWNVHCATNGVEADDVWKILKDWEKADDEHDDVLYWAE